MQEIRWRGQGRIDKPDYTLLYSGSEGKKGQLGTGFMMNTAMKECLLEFEPRSNRIAEDKMAGPRKENGSRGDAKKDNGRTTVYRKMERKTPSEMDR